MVLAVQVDRSVVPLTRPAPRDRSQAVLALYKAGITTARISEVTGYSRRRVTAITRGFLEQSIKNARIEDLRAKLFVDLEEVKALVLDALLFGDDLSPRERAQQTNALIKIVHEQALLVGAHSPKQIAVTSEAPPVNEEAQAYAEKVVRFMELSEKLAAIGPPRTQLTTEYADELIEAEVAEPEVPELLRQFEDQYEERAPSSVPINFDL